VYKLPSLPGDSLSANGITPPVPFSINCPFPSANQKQKSIDMLMIIQGLYIMNQKNKKLL